MNDENQRLPTNVAVKFMQISKTHKSGIKRQDIKKFQLIVAQNSMLGIFKKYFGKSEKNPIFLFSTLYIYPIFPLEKLDWIGEDYITKFIPSFDRDKYVKKGKKILIHTLLQILD